MTQNNENWVFGGGVYHGCEYCDCEKEATEYDADLEAWLCDTHIDGNPVADSGYCTTECRLGYGCDGSC